jgi:methyl-accepting chemotaxis protein
MLDSFKKGQPSQAGELQALIASSREERAALSTMLTQIQLQSSKLAAAGKALQNVEELVDNATARLDGIVERLAMLESRSLKLERASARIDALGQQVSKAEESVAAITAPEGDIAPQPGRSNRNRPPNRRLERAARRRNEGLASAGR